MMPTESQQLRDERQARKIKGLYGHIVGVKDPALLMQSARRFGNRGDLHETLLTHLYTHSRFQHLPRAEWEEQVQFAVALDFILKHNLEDADFTEFQYLFDMPATEAAFAPLDAAGGALVLVIHGGYTTFVRKLLKWRYPDREEIGRSGVLSAGANAGAALFGGVRVLAEGRKLLIAPDGPYGTQTSAIKVLGAECPTADGAAFLAYESGAAVAWLTVSRGDNGFFPVVRIGPSRERALSFVNYRERLLGFYADMITEAFTGDPRGLSLSARWRKYFADAGF